MNSSAWLGESTQLDLSHPKLRITAQKLTQSRQTWAGRAAAIHAYVRNLPFAAAVDGDLVRASEVLRRGCGDCHSKGVLFAALCRVAGLPARLRFLDVRTRFLAGLLDEGPAVLPHAVGEVLVDGRWCRTDGYVVDPQLFVQAKARLRESGLECGWGLVRDARGVWEGAGDSLHQFHPADLVQDFGPHSDPAAFYAQGGHRAGWLALAVGTRLLNRRVARLRRSPPIFLLSSTPS